MTIPFADGTCQLVVLTSALVVGASTTGVATIEPRLRKSPANAATVEVQYPYALMALTSDMSVGQLILANATALRLKRKRLSDVSP